MIDRWVELGGTNPAVNPIIKFGMRAPEMTTLSDSEIVPGSMRKKYPIWGEFYEPYDLPHICFTPIWRDGSAHMTLVVCRSARKGEYQAHEREVFSIIARHCREAAKTAEVIGREAGYILSGAFDAISASAFALDAFGRVVALSERAEDWLVRGDVLRLNSRKLGGTTAEGDRLIADALRPLLIVGSSSGSATSIRVPGRAGASVRLRIARLPRDRVSHGFGPIAIAIVEEDLSAAFRDVVATLTTAERQVALALMQGDRPNGIALARDVSIHTVRAQLKSIYKKFDVSGQVEYLAKSRAHA
jgi:DNA-binding CsgD family transcriptional regulator